MILMCIYLAASEAVGLRVSCLPGFRGASQRCLPHRRREHNLACSQWRLDALNHRNFRGSSDVCERGYFECGFSGEHRCLRNCPTREALPPVPATAGFPGRDSVDGGLSRGRGPPTAGRCRFADGGERQCQGVLPARDVRGTERGRGVHVARSVSELWEARQAARNCLRQVRFCPRCSDALARPIETGSGHSTDKMTNSWIEIWTFCNFIWGHSVSNQHSEIRHHHLRFWWNLAWR